ncbi:MAG: carboxypeptidase regulatory-like domain-containing protein [Deltaproteobacteria bacterium]|nr:carboxypeptidase regulatory-like domain-containing protein [Deltaproteobacteria bacterium]
MMNCGWDVLKTLGCASVHRVVYLLMFCGTLAFASPLWAGTLSGRVIDGPTGEPIAGATVRTVGGQTGVTDDDGNYQIGDLPAGDYFLFISPAPEGYVVKVFGGLDCPEIRPFGDCSANSGERVTLGEGETRDGLDFSLLPEGEIRGRVAATSTGEPLEVGVQLFWTTDPIAGPTLATSMVSEPDGTYRLRGLPPGVFQLGTANASPYFDEIYEDLHCSNLCDPYFGREVAVGQGQVTGGIDFDLDLPARIEGRISSTTGVPIQGEVLGLLFEPEMESNPNFATFSDENGDYFLGGLVPGTYFVRTFLNEEWVDEVFDDRLCPQSDGTCVITDGMPLELTEGQTLSSIDFVLEEGARISGFVRDAEDQAPLDSRVYALNGNGDVFRSTPSASDGSYQLSGLAPGTYYLLSNHSLGYLPQLYEGLRCGRDDAVPGCDVTAGTAITVGFGDSVQNIDFALEKAGECVPFSTRLCLNGGRFAVDMDWRVQNGNSGVGQAVDLTFADDSGYFWFFNQDNVEVIVKVLDACETSFNSFWVFAAGLTNVGVDMTVTDTLTGAVQVYNSPLSMPFQPILDTRAFSTCEASEAREVSEAASHGRSPWPVESSHLLGRGQRTTGDGGCVPSATGLCLQDNRFLVEAIWQKPNGEQGPALAEGLTGDTGFFWFFRESNVELVVKVLDACNGPERFWVFAGGQTNLAVTLRVTDTVTGEVNTYVNPQSTPFQPIQDTQAFATCAEGAELD